MEDVKIMIIGSGFVGKTAVASRFTMDLFLDQQFNPERGTFRKNLEVDGIPVALEIHHYVAPEDWNTREITIRDCDGFILMYSIIAQSTFNDVPDLLEQILRVKDRDDVPMIIVGNKHDFRDERGDSSSNMKLITYQQGQQMATARRCGFYEVSAKTNYNVNDLFIDLIHRVIKEKKEFRAINQSKGSKRSCRMH